MRIKSLSYLENLGNSGANPWELKRLTLSHHNLVIGKNATGKTRIVNLIFCLARLIQLPLEIKSDSKWDISFETVDGSAFDFSVAFDKGKIVEECISVQGVEQLKRSASSTQIRSNSSKEWQSISPPADRLVLHVRRDKKEFPFLEELTAWAEGVRGYSFANTSPFNIEIPGNPFQLTSLNAVPSILEQLPKENLNSVLNEFNQMGYPLEGASVGVSEGLPPTAKIVFFKEKGIQNLLKQFEISQGMFRAFSLLTIIEFLKSSGKMGCILVDDLCEGLDYERSKKLAKIIFEKESTRQFQFVSTSNDLFLTNTVSLDELTVCYRKGHVVECLNYTNAKDKFDSWQKLGLNNFDLLSSNFLLD